MTTLWSRASHYEPRPLTTPSLAVITTLAFAVDFAGEIVNVNNYVRFLF